MIDITKKYTTRDGREVTLYAVVGDYVHGRIGNAGPITWEAKSGHWTATNWQSPADLIPAPREFWVNVYAHPCGHVVYDTRKQADKLAGPSRIACVRVVEGQGLEGGDQ